MFLVGQRAAQQAGDFRFGERLQGVDAGAREQRRDDLEGRILRGRADEDDISGFHVGQKSVLLGLVEAMHFVDKNNGPASGAPRVFGGGHHVLDLANAAEHRAEGDKFGVRAARDQARERGLAAAGRSPQNHRAEIVAFDGHAQRLAGAEQRLLPGKLLERARTHPLGQRGGGGDRVSFDFGEKAHAGFAQCFAL